MDKIIKLINVEARINVEGGKIINVEGGQNMWSVDKICGGWKFYNDMDNICPKNE